ncbi:MAG: DUF1501 domain-containing protein [Planctomycetaceae bacterium]|nr:DUF1501 domain-containing protein [Planctomycetaceae bacterium]
MLRILGNRRTLGEGCSRRELLQAGSLGLLGLTSGALSPPRGLASSGVPARGFGQAKRCILLYLYGAASQLETFDPKPGAPREVRGELGAISTRVPGLQIGELLPRTAEIVDRMTIVRSMTHPYPLHASAFTLTSIPTIDVPLQMSPRDPRHWPFIGSVVDYLADRRGEPAGPIPRNVALPWRLSSRRPYAAGDNAGPYGAWLGAAYDPLWSDFQGEGKRVSTYTFGAETIRCRDPYGPLEPGCRFTLAADAALPAGLTLDRLHQRKSLVEQFDAARRDFDDPRATRSFDHFRRQAYAYLTTDTLRAALDVDREPLPLREQYGMTLFGQATLVARRLLEAGSQFATVIWDEFELVNSAWDTHFYHYELMREQLCPGFDRAFSALILDLEARGMLDDTLVVCTTEHGRTPKLEKATGGGRGHWAQAYSSILAGGGVARGKVVGGTDRIAGAVVDTPISPKDLLATMYHLLGHDPEQTIHDRLGRPVAIAGEGKVRHELLA